MTETTSADHKRKTQNDELRAATRVTVIGMVLDAVLGAIKCVGGILFHSQALLVDGIHSFTDVASDLVVLGVMKASRQEPDQAHPYGHQRFETMGTMILGSILIAVGGALAWENLQHLLHQSEDLQVPEWPVLVAALVSVLAKEWIYRYTRRVGEAIRSDLIIANAWHSRTDAFSSVVVLLSTVGAMLGYVWLDILAAVIIAVIIGRIGWRFAWDSVRELVDTALSPEDTENLTRIARETEGVRSVHELRSRRMGHNILVDVHLEVKPDISVSEGHQIGMRVVGGMREAFPDIGMINFHIDAEKDDEATPTDTHLPGRQEIRDLLSDCLSEMPDHCHLRLHYLGNRVHLEVFITRSEADTSPGLETRIREKLAGEPWLGSLRIWYPAPEQPSH